MRTYIPGAVAAILVAAVALFAVAAARQPAEFDVMRAAIIKAPAAKIFAQVNNLHHWEAWSPWARLDPEAKNSFEGPEAGTGAIMRWDGNMKVGKGSMTITESRPGTLILFKLDFVKPLAATHTAEFRFKPKSDYTTVVWRMSGTRDFPAKAMGLLFNCEKTIGKQFAQGLENLRAIVEKKP